ncbi:MAG: glutamate-cysteine ligase family protein [Lachnospiraceae bacterium]
MEHQLLRQLLYNKYIVPTQGERPQYIGVEIELPILNLERKAVDFTNIHQVTASFQEKFAFEIQLSDDEGEVYALSDPITGDVLSYDCSYNNLEFSFGRATDLHSIQKRFVAYYSFIQEKLTAFHYTLTGLGINPYHKYNQNLPIPSERYRMLFHHLQSYEKHDGSKQFHSYPSYGMFSSATQVQLDVREDELLAMLRVFSKLEPVKALLFANSYMEEEPGYLCYRDLLWEKSMQGYNAHNIGGYEYELEDEEELLEYLMSTSIYCVIRNHKYIHFTPVPIREYFNSSEIKGEYFDGTSYVTTSFVPSPEDLEFLRTYKFVDLTYRGTIEFRSVCSQPVSEAMTSAAFHLGLRSELESLEKLLDSDRSLFHHGFSSMELREICNRREWQDFMEREDIASFLLDILRLAEQGLRRRGLGEETYLAPLFIRAKRCTNPARTMLEYLESGSSMEDIIHRYAKI